MWVSLIVKITETIRLFTASLFAHVKESERSKRKVRGGWGGGGEFVSEVFRFALAASSLAISSAHSTIE